MAPRKYLISSRRERARLANYIRAERPPEEMAPVEYRFALSRIYEALTKYRHELTGESYVYSAYIIANIEDIAREWTP